MKRERKEGSKREQGGGRAREREGEEEGGQVKERKGKGEQKEVKERGDCQPSLYLAELYMVQDKSNDFMDTWDFLETRLGDIKDLNKIYAEV